MKHLHNEKPYWFETERDAINAFYAIPFKPGEKNFPYFYLPADEVHTENSIKTLGREIAGDALVSVQPTLSWRVENGTYYRLYKIIPAYNPH